MSEPSALLELGEAFFAELEARAAAGDAAALATTPADPVAKSVARNNRRDGGRAEAEEPCAAVS